MISAFTTRLAPIGALAATVTLTLSLGSAHAQTERSLQQIKIAAVSGSVMPQDFRAGIERGIFRKHGLELAITELATGTNNITAAVQGSADIAYADVFAGLSSIKNGFDIGLVAPHNGASPYQYLLVRDDSPLKTIQDLKGANIALGAPPQFKALTAAVLEGQGLDPKSVKFTIVPDQTTYGALLAAKQADVISTSSSVNAYKWIHQYKLRPIGETAKAQLKLADGSPIAGWWSTGTWFAKNRDTANRFRDALRETITWYQTLSKEERAAIVLAQTKIDLVALDKETPGVLQAGTTHFGFGGPVDLPKLQTWIDIGNKYANVPADVDLTKHIFETARN